MNKVRPKAISSARRSMNMLQNSRNWYDAEVRLKMVVENEKAEEDAMRNIVRVVDKIRIGAKPEVIVSNGRPFNEILHNSSKDADLVFLGMTEPDKDFTSYYEGLQHQDKDFDQIAMQLPLQIYVD